MADKDGELKREGPTARLRILLAMASKSVQLALMPNARDAIVAVVPVLDEVVDLRREVDELRGRIIALEDAKENRSCLDD